MFPLLVVQKPAPCDLGPRGEFQEQRADEVAREVFDVQWSVPEIMTAGPVLAGIYVGAWLTLGCDGWLGCGRRFRSCRAGGRRAVASGKVQSVVIRIRVCRLIGVCRFFKKLS